MDIVDENDTYFFTASFFDQDKKPITPTSGTWRIDDTTGGQSVPVTGSTPFSPTSETFQFEVVSNENRILNSANPIEVRTAIVTMIYGSGRQKTGKHSWKVNKL